MFSAVTAMIGGIFGGGRSGSLGRMACDEDRKGVGWSDTRILNVGSPVQVLQSDSGDFGPTKMGVTGTRAEDFG